MNRRALDEELEEKVIEYILNFYDPGDAFHIWTDIDVEKRDRTTIIVMSSEEIYDTYIEIQIEYTEQGWDVTVAFEGSKQEGWSPAKKSLHIPDEFDDEEEVADRILHLIEEDVLKGAETDLLEYTKTIKTPEDIAEERAEYSDRYYERED